MNKQQPIGVIDSGVGGLTVLRRLQELMPHEHFIFLGDTLNTPYGNRSREDIIRLVNQMTDYLSYRNIKGSGCGVQYDYGPGRRNHPQRP